MTDNKKTNQVVLILTFITFLFLVFLLFLLEVNFFINFLISASIALILWVAFKKKEREKKPTHLKSVSQKKKAHYQSKGLSDEDIEFFRKTLHTAKLDILAIENEIKKEKKLILIAKRYQLIDTCKSYFKEIVNHPDQIHEVDRFLYVYLPSLKELLMKYNALYQQERKSKETFAVLQKSRKTIDEICSKITQDHEQFTLKISEELKDSIEEIDPLI